MGNTFLTLQDIARKALPRLIENLVFPNLVYRDYSKTFASHGDTIRIRKPVNLTAAEFDEESGVSYGDMEETAVSVTLDKLATVDVSASAVETAVNIDDLNRVFIEPAAAALAEKINADGLELYRDIPTFVGTAGTTPNALSDLANARRQLNRQKVPTVGRVAVWDPEADAAFTQIPAIVNAEKSGKTAALREGSIGRVMGLDNYMAQGVKTVASGNLTWGGTGATGLKVKDAVAEASSVVAVSNAASGGTLTGKVLAGDIVVLGGRHYVCTEEAAASSNMVTIKLNEAVTAPANAALTVVSGGTQNLAFHPLAFAFVTRPLYNPDGEGVMSYVTNFNGISLRVTKGYDQKYKRSNYSMDVLYGFRTIYPELACRVLG